MQALLGIVHRCHTGQESQAEGEECGGLVIRDVLCVPNDCREEWLLNCADNTD